MSEDQIGSELRTTVVAQLLAKTLFEEVSLRGGTGADVLEALRKTIAVTALSISKQTPGIDAKQIVLAMCGQAVASLDAMGRAK